MPEEIKKREGLIPPMNIESMLKSELSKRLSTSSIKTNDLIRYLMLMKLLNL